MVFTHKRHLGTTMGALHKTQSIPFFLKSQGFSATKHRFPEHSDDNRRAKPLAVRRKQNERATPQSIVPPTAENAHRVWTTIHMAIHSPC